MTALVSSSGTRAKATERCGPMEWLNGVRGAVSGTAPWCSSGLRTRPTMLATDCTVRPMSGTASLARRSLDMAAYPTSSASFGMRSVGISTGSSGAASGPRS